MKTGLNKVVVAAALCAAVILFAGSAWADDAQQVTQELVSGLNIPADVADSLASGPGDTFGQRLQGALNNGSITQRQYDTITNRFLALPDEKRWAIKGAYDAGKGINPETIHNVVNPQDEGSVRQHAKDLKDQGLTKEQIAARLKAEGVAPEHVKDIVYSQGVGGSQRGSHAKDIRDSGTQPQKVDKAHEGYQNRKAEPSVADHAKDRPQGTKSLRDNYKAGRPAARDMGHGAVQRRR